MTDNRITIENQRTDGVRSQSYWDAASSDAIEGFATDISVNAGDTIDFKINVNGDTGADNAYRIEIFRLGYYGGAGAREVASITNQHGTVQDLPTYDPGLKLVDAGNWDVTDHWDVPQDMVSGVFLARVQTLDANGQPIPGETNQIPFIVRNDGVAADIVLQTSDTTWQAYNGWCGKLADEIGNGDTGGPNLYGDPSDLSHHSDNVGSERDDRAYAVSYNRPIETRDHLGTYAGPQDYLFGADYAAIYSLEQNGYDVSYISGVDTDRLGADYLKNYKAFISVGHDEYWSGDQRANVAEARDAGVNLLFWSGNECYWKTRYEGSTTGGDSDYRTLICYKETFAVTDPAAGPNDYVNLDPTDIWTGTWQDVRFAGNPAAGAGDRSISPGQLAYCHCGQNALIGQLFVGDGTGEFGAALDVPSELAQLRMWRDTTVASGNGAQNIAPGLIGYEWDYAPNDANRPAGLIKLSETTVDWGALLIDDGNVTAPGTQTHTLTLYRAESGALVFGAGTTFWSWGLSNEHDGSPYDANIANKSLQQFTINLFADMGIQPGVSDLVLASRGLLRAHASTDTADATATFSTPAQAVSQYSKVTISGTATDDDGNSQTEDGHVALVEVSFDSGSTWHAATGTTNWSYTFAARQQGTATVLVRAIDDSLNLPAVSSLASQTITITKPTTPPQITLFDTVEVAGAVSNDSMRLTLGTKFEASSSGSITELHYFRGQADAYDRDVRIGKLYDDQGRLIAHATFKSDPGETGWQTAQLSTPISIAAGSEYTVAYVTEDNYYATTNYFTAGDYREPYGVLSAPGSAENGAYAVGSTFPDQTYRGSNYWVDVTFEVTTGGVTITGTAGNDTISMKKAPPGQPKATAGNDVLDGLGGNDVLDGGAGADRMIGGSGNDTYVVDNASDLVIESVSGGGDAGGTDLVKSSVPFALGAFVERLTLTGIGVIDGVGNGLANKLTGNNSDNILSGFDGNDTIAGGGGADTLHGDDGNDRLIGAANTDYLYGGTGDDYLDGGTEADGMYGGSGADTYIVDHLGDLVLDTLGQTTDDGAIDVVNASVTFALGAFVEILKLTGVGNINGGGNDLANTLSGNSSNNILVGEGGNDTISSGSGNDVLIGGAGADRLTGGGGADIFVLGPPSPTSDSVRDFSSGQGDKVGIAANDFGLSGGNGMTASGDLDEGWFVQTSTNGQGTADHGQFIFNTTTRTLMWDADGSGGDKGISLATFNSGTTLNTDYFQVSDSGLFVV